MMNSLRQDKAEAIATDADIKAICVPQQSSVKVSMMRILLGLGLLLALAAPPFAESAAVSLPENAHVKSYGDGWECDLGYRADGNTCAAITVPENAYETNRTYGAGWECLHGFRETDRSSCVAVVIPDGGFLDSSGAGWRCLRAHRKVDDTCQKILLPEHAYLDENAYGSGWLCDRGFEVDEGVCSEIVVPENAFLNASGYGQPWTCERGFFERDGRCDAIVVPEHAYFSDASYGKGWKCERGYAASGQRCDVINLPDNAHLDRSGNRWECDKNFQKSIGLCILNN
jgi:hypothetical protein